MKKLLTQYGGLKREIYILFIGSLVTAMGSFVWPMLTFFLTTKLGFSDGTATLLIAIATTMSLPAALLGGKLADRFSRKKIIIVFDILTVSFYFVAAVTPIGIHTAMIIFLAGLFQTMESPAYDALNADFSTTSQREKAFSLSYLGFNLGFIVGASLSGVLFENHIALAFLLNGLSILVSTVLIWIFVDPKNAVGDSVKEEESYGEYEMPVEQTRSILSVLKERRVVGLMILVGCFASMPEILTGILLPLQLKQSMGQAGATLYGYLNSLNGFTVILFTPILTMLLRSFTEIPKAAGGLVLYIVGMALFSLGVEPWILLIGMFIYTVGEVSMVIGIDPYRSRRIPASHRGRIGGISSVIHSLFCSLLQFGISFILTASHSNYRMLWMIFIAGGFVGLALYAVAYGMDRKQFPNLYARKE